MEDLIEKLKKYHRGFSDIEKEAACGYELRESNILISAPHATRRYRRGEKLGRDGITGSIAKLLGEMTGASVMYTQCDNQLDPNFYDGVKYKHTLEKLVKENNINFLIDLHAAREEREFDIDLGMMGEKNTEETQSLKRHYWVLGIFKESFKKAGIQKISYNYFPAKTQRTVTRFAVEKLGIPAIQVEIHQKYRTTKEKENLMKTLKALTDVITILDEEFSTIKKSSYYY